MGTISAGIGLLSGLPIDDIIQQLLSIEARPLRLLEREVSLIQAQRTAFLELSARLLSLKSGFSRLDSRSFFEASRTTSSNENVLLATAEDGAQTGSFTFQVHSLVRTHQLVSAGFADADTKPVGAGRITVEGGQASLAASTDLDALNGLAGVRRGTIRVTDRAGESIDLDLTAALTVDDVLDAFNNQTTVAVRARVQGDRIIVEDGSGGTGNLSVVDLGQGKTAADLGIAGIVAANTLVGSDVVRLVGTTALDLLNDGNGVRRDATKQDDLQINAGDGSVFNIKLNSDLRAGTRLAQLNSGNGVRLGTIRITPRSGDAIEVDLSGAQTVGEVIDAINTAFDGAAVQVTASIVPNSSGLRLTLTGVPDPASDDPALPNFLVEDVTGFAAQDLGIAADVNDNTIDGNDIFRITTIGDVLAAINFAVDDNGVANGGRVVASLTTDGNGITLSDGTGGVGALIVTSPFGHAAEDLGIAGTFAGGTVQSRDLIAGLNTVLVRSINGGAGVTLGALDVTLRDGSAGSIDLAGAQTVAQIVDAINNNAAGLSISATINNVGNGIVLRDESGGTGNLVVSDGAGGTSATDLNLLVNAAVDQVGSGNLQRQYISEATRLEDLNLGGGISRGKFRITDSSGLSAVVDLTQGNEVAIGDVLREINSRNIGVTARINDTGDGILLEDTAGGTGLLTIAEQGGGATAASLNILGTAKEGQTRIDGSFEITIDIDADDTLNDLTDKLNAAGAGVTASIINDGSGIKPFRLVLTSRTAGRQGRVLIDPGSTGVALHTLIEPRDALVFLGSSASSNSVLINSSTNTLTDVIPGVTLDLVGTDRQPVDVTVERDIDAMVDGIARFVEGFNGIVDKIGDLTDFNSETGERAILQGDSGVRLIQNRLFAGVLPGAITTSDPAINRLSRVGLTFRGGRLRLDQQVLRDALANSPDAVAELFTDEDDGFGVTFKKVLERLTDGPDGLLPRQDLRLGNREELLNERAENLQELLNLKEQRLRSQFLAMERSLARLQAQQAALGALVIIDFSPNPLR